MLDVSRCGGGDMRTTTERIDARALTAWLREAADALGMDDRTYCELLQRISARVDHEGYVTARVIRGAYYQRC